MTASSRLRTPTQPPTRLDRLHSIGPAPADRLPADSTNASCGFVTHTRHVCRVTSASLAGRGKNWMTTRTIRDFGKRQDGHHAANDGRLQASDREAFADVFEADHIAPGSVAAEGVDFEAINPCFSRILSFCLRWDPPLVSKRVTRVPLTRQKVPQRGIVYPPTDAVFQPSLKKPPSRFQRRTDHVSSG